MRLYEQMMEAVHGEEDVQVRHVVGCGLRDPEVEQMELPDPAVGYVRGWIGTSKAIPRPMTCKVTENRVVALLRFTRDFVDVLGEEIREDLTSCIVARRVLSEMLEERQRHSYRTFVVDVIEDGIVKSSKEYKSLLEAMAGFSKNVPEAADPETTTRWLLETIGKKAVSDDAVRDTARNLKATGLLGVFDEKCTIRDGVVDAIQRGLFDLPVMTESYMKEGKIGEGHLAVLMRIGVLCPRCTGLTWGSPGYEVVRVIREGLE